MSQRNKFSRHQPASRADKYRQPYDLAGTAEQKTRNAYSAISSRPGNPTGMVAVIIPTFNERDNLEPIVSRVRTAVPAADVLVVDDDSPDGTGEIADELAVTDGHVFVLHQAGKAGIGAAYIAGFGWALDRGYGALVEMDADGSHDPAELPRLLHALETADLVIGSRWVPGSAVRSWSRSREILSRAANAYAGLMLGLDVRDATGGYRVYRADTLRSIGAGQVASNGHCFQIDLTLRAVQAGQTVAEVPITFAGRTSGQSKMSPSIVVEAFLRVAQWGILARLGRIRPGQHASPRRVPSCRRPA
jgi:dolichol-phosphate mannosyltransferase